MTNDIFSIYKDSSFQQLTNGTRIAYTDVGEGSETLLFLHGMGSNQKAWAKNISVLKESYRCIAVDLPGYGWSDDLNVAYSIPQVAEVVAEFIELQQLDAVTLVGHSMGGHVSLEVARQKVAPVKKLVLAAPAGIEIFQPQEIEMIEKFFTAELLLTYTAGIIKKNYALNFFSMPEDAKFMISDRIEMSKDEPRYRRFCNTVAETTMAIVTHNMLPYLSELTLPVLILFGSEDKLIPHHIVHPESKTEQLALAAVDKLQNGKLVIYEDCGHFVQWEESHDFNNELREFVA